MMKTMMKKSFKLLLILTLCVCSSALADDGYLSGDYNYLPLEDGTALIVSYNNWISKRISIPRQIDDYIVSAIGAKAFASHDELTSVSIPNSIKIIGESAFEECIEITSIVIPDTVESIGDYAFSGCVKLKTINLPCGLNEIGANPFCGGTVKSIL